MLDMILRILGLIVLGGLIGALIGLVIMPFVLYLAYLVAYTIASIIAVVILRKRTLRKRLIGFQQFVNPMNDIIHQSDNKQASIRYTNHIPDLRNNRDGMVDRNIMSQSQMTQNPTTTKYKTANQNVFDVVNQPTIKNTLNTLRNVVHRIILFYRSYYGHSTKVEKNQGSLLLSSGIGFIINWTSITTLVASGGGYE